MLTIGFACILSTSSPASLLPQKRCKISATFFQNLIRPTRRAIIRIRGRARGRGRGHRLQHLVASHRLQQQRHSLKRWRSEDAANNSSSSSSKGKSAWVLVKLTKNTLRFRSFGRPGTRAGAGSLCRMRGVAPAFWDLGSVRTKVPVRKGRHCAAKKAVRVRRLRRRPAVIQV